MFVFLQKGMEGSANLEKAFEIEGARDLSGADVCEEAGKIVVEDHGVLLREAQAEVERDHGIVRMEMIIVDG